MASPSTDLSPAADAVRMDERTAILRLTAGVAAEAARAAGQKENAEVSVNFVHFILTQAFAARDTELERLRASADRGETDRSG